MTRADIYLDAQGTERPRPEAIAEIKYYLSEGYGNPSATANAKGRSALSNLESMRERTAEIFGVAADGVIFTSGATEANNLVLASLVGGQRGLIASATEHKSVLEPAVRLAQSGARVDICPVLPSGILNMDALSTMLKGGDSVVSVMHANNEIGVIQPLSEIALMCQRKGALLHVDAAQTAGKMPVNLSEIGADALTISGHKFGGPVGSGALLLSARAYDQIVPQIIGGGQEAGLRAGTTPVAIIAGMVAALEKSTSEQAEAEAEIRALRDRLVAGICDLPGYFLNGHPVERLACNFSGGFEGVEATLLMRRMPNINIAAGSACTTGRSTSHVLKAIGLSDARRRATMRISLGWSTTAAEVASVIDQIRRVVAGLQNTAST